MGGAQGIVNGGVVCMRGYHKWVYRVVPGPMLWHTLSVCAQCHQCFASAYTTPRAFWVSDEGRNVHSTTFASKSTITIFGGRVILVGHTAGLYGKYAFAPCQQRYITECK